MCYARGLESNIQSDPIQSNEPIVLLPCLLLLQVYDDKCLQQDIFDITARPIVDSVLEGYNGASGSQGVSYYVSVSALLS